MADEAQQQMVDGERRAATERRIEALERNVQALTLGVKVTEVKVEGLVETMKSRHEALTRGQDLILDRITKLAPVGDLIDVKHQVDALQRTADRALGAMYFAQALGALGVIGGVIAFVKAMAVAGALSR